MQYLSRSKTLAIDELISTDESSHINPISDAMIVNLLLLVFLCKIDLAHNSLLRLVPVIRYQLSQGGSSRDMKENLPSTIYACPMSLGLTKRHRKRY